MSEDEIIETKKNIDFWEREVQKHLKNNEIMQAVGCRLLANNLRESIGEEKNMSADEMFKELGYEKIENKIQITYVKPYENIQFLLNVKKIEYNFLKGSTFLTQTMEELKEINKKVEELKWI